MNGVTALWSMAFAVSAMLGIIYGMVWLSRRHLVANGWFALMALGTALMALGDLALMQSKTPAQWGEIARWYQVPSFLAIVSMVFFVRTYLRAGQPSLAWSVCILRAVALVCDFTTGENLNFRHVTSLHHMTFLGEPVVVGTGDRNPWMLLAQLALVLLIVFVVDASIQVWKRGERLRAITAGGAIVFFVVAASATAILTLWGIITAPIIISLFFAGVAVVMGFELGRDILRAERLTTDLREGEQRLMLAAEAAKFGVWTRDPTGGAIWASDTWRRLFGFEKTEVVTFEDVLMRVHPDDRAAVQQILRTTSRSDNTYDLEYRIVLPDARVRWISSHGRFEAGDRGALRLAHGVSVDVTERKNAENEVHERRAELTHLSRVAMLGELSGSLAHELNQPLTAILSNAQAALRFLDRPDFDRSEITEILRDIVDADQRAGEVIRSLRALFRKEEIQRVPLDVNAPVNDTLRLVRSDVLNRQIVVTADLCESAPRVRGDRVQLQQVLLNLVFNAVDAISEMDNAKRRLRVSTSLSAGGVRIGVRDHGPGISDEVKGKIFEPFFTTKPHGMGLGLSVCNSILAAHGSRLELLDHEDGGAEFFFVLALEGETA
ncbi:MAG TPA: ATP-binding protein [Chthoniobacterales bacterium]